MVCDDFLSQFLSPRSLMRGLRDPADSAAPRASLQGHVEPGDGLHYRSTTPDRYNHLPPPARRRETSSRPKAEWIPRSLLEEQRAGGGIQDSRRGGSLLPLFLEEPVLPQ